jgi:hypothetical protein
MVEVELIANQTRYTLPNYSGAPVDIGDTVQIFSNGLIANGYIGTSPNIEHDIKVYEGKVESIALESEKEKTICQILFYAVRNTVANIVFNASILGLDNSNVEFSVYLDDELQEYKPIVSLTVDKYSMVNFVIPVHISKGNHSIKICAVGTGEIKRGCSYVNGQYLSELNEIVYDKTTDSDYIYIKEDSGTNVVLYIGQSNKPKIPTAINGQLVKTLHSSAFNTSYVEAVYIPDGVVEIE